MRRVGLYLASTVLLVLVIEVYIWVEASLTDSAVSKMVLIGLYGAVAVLSEYVATRSVGYGLGRAVTMNLLVAALISLWLVLSGLVFHPGLIKDVPATLASTSLSFFRFFCTIGLATILLRLLAALVSGRWAKPEARRLSQIENA